MCSNGRASQNSKSPLIFVQQPRRNERMEVAKTDPNYKVTWNNTASNKKWIWTNGPVNPLFSFHFQILGLSNVICEQFQQMFRDAKNRPYGLTTP